MFPRPASCPIASLLIGLALCLTAIPAVGEPAHARCGSEVQVREGETLSSLAERCDITEARILDLNPNVEGSKDLRAGMTLNLAAPSGNNWVEARRAVDSVFARLKSYAEEVDQTIDQVAEATRQSIDESIERNPELHQSVNKLGQRLNIPGMEKVEAQVSLSVRKGPRGSPVTLSAIGLPANRPVDIAGGIPGSTYQIIKTARTSGRGTLQVTVLLPSWADPERDFIFVIAMPDNDVAVRSAAFDVLEQRAGR
jgi:LysM repeat protein